MENIGITFGGIQNDEIAANQEKNSKIKKFKIEIKMLNLNKCVNGLSRALKNLKLLLFNKYFLQKTLLLSKCLNF